MPGREVAAKLDRLRDAFCKIKNPVSGRTIRRYCMPIYSVVGLPDRTVITDPNSIVGIQIIKEELDVPSFISFARSNTAENWRLAAAPDICRVSLRLPTPFNRKFESINGDDCWVDTVLKPNGNRISNLDRPTKFLVVTSQLAERIKGQIQINESYNNVVDPELDEKLEEIFPGIDSFTHRLFSSQL